MVLNNGHKKIAEDNTPKTTWIVTQYRRLVGIAIAPRKTLPRLATEGDSWIPILIVALLLALTRMTMLDDLREEYRTEDFRDRYAEQRGISKNEADQNIEKMIQSAPLITILESPMIIILSVGLTATILLMIGRFGFNGTIPFRHIFNMTAWASVVSSIPLLINLPLELSGASWNIPTSPAEILPTDLKDGYFYGVLSAFDIFMLWEGWIISAALSVMYKVSFQRAVTAVGTMIIAFAVMNGLAMIVVSK